LLLALKTGLPSNSSFFNIADSIVRFDPLISEIKEKLIERSLGEPLFVTPKLISLKDAIFIPIGLSVSDISSRNREPFKI
jgi:hypothetical protein